MAHGQRASMKANKCQLFTGRRAQGREDCMHRTKFSKRMTHRMERRQRRQAIEESLTIATGEYELSERQQQELEYEQSYWMDYYEDFMDSLMEQEDNHQRAMEEEDDRILRLMEAEYEEHYYDDDGYLH